MLKTFTRYFSIGIINTAIHWIVFYSVYMILDVQSVSNIFGFMAAVTFSFFANARWTFKSEVTTIRYIAMVTFMGTLSWFIGKQADSNQLPPLLTLVFFSGTNLVVGFLFSKFFVFRGHN